MFVEEVIIDGFKSYATRTSVGPFDPAFNAITGLNGSGKSNILDSICFVLGISNLSQVRAGTLQELVYKQGQAGVQKATVTIVFNNRDRSNSPVGYEESETITITRQIVIGGRNKYLINGVVAQPNRVQNLFHSVQLNVNNPHFLIMQGRITKVINMKPPEILAMVEEAAGTRMYEMKKDTAVKTIEKKQKKVEEIDHLLKDEITPSLEKLRAERSLYMRWSAITSEYNSLERISVAFDFWQTQKHVTSIESNTMELHRKINDIEASKKREETNIREHRKNLSRIQAHREKLGISNLASMVRDVEESAKELVKFNAKVSGLEDSLKTERQLLIEKKEELGKSRDSLDSKREEVKKSRNTVADVGELVKGALAEVEASRRALLTGKEDGSPGGSEFSSVASQIDSAKRAMHEADMSLERAKVRRQHLTSELTEKREILERDEVNSKQAKDEEAQSRRTIQEIELQLMELDYEEARHKALEEERKACSREVHRLREQSEDLGAKLARFDLRNEISDSELRTGKVKGVIGSLISCPLPAHFTAIEVTAGGKLYQVVVDTDKTGKELLRSGSVKRRITIIPLNRIDASVLDGTVIRRAKAIDSRASLALNLIGYDSELENAMKYVFGRTIICPEMDSARKITFDNEIRTRTVTLEGDSFDPSGTLSGGSSARGQDSSILSQLSQYKSLRDELSVAEKKVQMLDRECEALSKKMECFRLLSNKLELAKHEASLIQNRLLESSFGQLLEQVRTIQKELSEELPQMESSALAAKKENEEKLSRLEQQAVETDTTHDASEKQARARVEAAKKRHDALTAEYHEAADIQRRLEIAISELEESIELLDREVSSGETALASLEGKLDEASKALQDRRSIYDEKVAKTEAEKEKSRVESQSIGVESEKLKRAEEEYEKFELELKRLNHDAITLTKDREDFEASVTRLMSNHSWIQEEKESFGISGGPFDFEKKKPSEVKKRLTQLEKERQDLSSKVNKRAMSLFEKAEQDYVDLQSKKAIIEKDKEKIQRVIQELDEKKNSTLKMTWEKVNRDFSSIFSTLLPGAQAKLEPPEGRTVLDGLEIRVAFGDVWKESLSELSGGQRSLIALSLILAMLLFKPAPMYILDEVDAALDLSHTQNIGRMLRTHFSNSQFIVVSLKEGMFNNANVIFRTRFSEGISSVSRTVNRAAAASPKKRLRLPTEDNKENDAPTEIV